MRTLCLITALLFIFAAFTPLVMAAVSPGGHGGPCVCKADVVVCAEGKSCPVDCPHHGEGRKGHGDDRGRGDHAEEAREETATYDDDRDASSHVLSCGCRGHGANPAAQIDHPFVAAGANGPSLEQPSFSYPETCPLYTGPAAAVPDRPPSA